MIHLTDEQLGVLEGVERFLAQRRPPRPYYVLHGLAGVGKTVCMAELARRNPGMILCAFTGKAASVLRKRVDCPVSTIHSAIYQFRGMVEDDEEPGRMVPVFDDARQDYRGRVMLIDEASMVGRRVAEDIFATGARVVACGDPGQLPPVRDAQFFTEPDAVLTKVHRQALESPIIRQAHRIRTTGNYGPDGDAFRMLDRAEPEDLLAADAILCYRNVTRRRLNARKRELLKRAGPLQAGEPIMCLSNRHDLGIYNGATYDLARDRDAEDLGLSLIVDDRVVHVDLATVEGEDEFETRRYEDEWTPFALGYASTVHRAQGSEWSSVLLFDECDTGDRRAFLYTGVTRAAERCAVVRWK